MNWLSKKAAIITNHKVFKVLIFSLIVLSAVLIGMETYPSISTRHYDLLILIDKIIIFCFSVELILRILSFGKKPYKFFTDGWNIFDFIVVAVCLIPTIDTHFFAILRILRILRVLRMVTFFPKLRLLVTALLKSIPSMGYVILLLTLLFYIYAVVGIFMFGKADTTHFGDLHHAIVTLFKVLTLEGWTDIMNVHLYGSEPETFQKITTIVPFIYFASFIVIGAMIIMNLFIGVIMNSMEESKDEINQELRNKNLNRKTHEELYLHVISQLDRLKEDIKDLKDFKKKNTNG
jgi:voltage-gated sodium channel